jgi:hypothetical protein
MSELPDFLDDLDLDVDVEDLPPMENLAAAEVAAGLVDPLEFTDLPEADLGEDSASAEEPKFAGVGCDCNFNPSTCGAGGFCRWQKR